jgi:hypothetical protein
LTKQNNPSRATAGRETIQKRKGNEMNIRQAVTDGLEAQGVIEGKARREGGHTVGPWRYHLGRGANPRFHVQTTAGYQIASTTEVSRNAIEASEQEANARLIASAPDLLAALESIAEAAEWSQAAAEKIPHTSEHCGGGTCHRCAAWRKAGEAARIARAAIAQAEGRV